MATDGIDSVRTGFGNSADGFLSTRNILVAAIVTSLGGSGTAFIQSNKGAADRYTGDEAKEDREEHRREHGKDRALLLAEYASISNRVRRLEDAVTSHQDGHPERLVVEIDRIKATQDDTVKAVRAIERIIDREIHSRDR